MHYNIDMADKLAELKKLEHELATNVSLPLRDTANLVFGEGNIDCTVMFIGEAPGANEDRERRPFVGRGGQLLNQMIESIGWKRCQCLRRLQKRARLHRARWPDENDRRGNGLGGAGDRAPPRDREGRQFRSQLSLED